MCTHACSCASVFTCVRVCVCVIIRRHTLTVPLCGVAIRVCVGDGNWIGLDASPSISMLSVCKAIPSAIWWRTKPWSSHNLALFREFLSHRTQCIWPHTAWDKEGKAVKQQVRYSLLSATATRPHPQHDGWGTCYSPENPTPRRMMQRRGNTGVMQTDASSLISVRRLWIMNEALCTSSLQALSSTPGYTSVFIKHHT